MSDCKWQYTNHQFPMSVLNLTTEADIWLLLRTFGEGHAGFDPDYCEATTGTSGVGCWEEGDIEYTDLEGALRTLSYDYMPIDDNYETGRVFRFATYANEE